MIFREKWLLIEKADYCAMKEHFDINWSEVLEESTIEQELWTLLLDTMTGCRGIGSSKVYMFKFIM